MQSPLYFILSGKGIKGVEIAGGVSDGRSTDVYRLRCAMRCVTPTNACVSVTATKPANCENRTAEKDS